MQISIGQRVSDLDGSHEGTLVAIEGATGYVLQKNGVEIDFPLSRLKPYQPSAVAQQRTLAGPLRDRALSPEHAALLASVPAAIMAAVAQSYASGAEDKAARPPFEALPPDKKLDAVRIHLPSLPQRLIAGHMKLVLAMRDLARPNR